MGPEGDPSEELRCGWQRSTPWEGWGPLQVCGTALALQPAATWVRAPVTTAPGLLPGLARLAAKREVWLLRGARWLQLPGL